MKLISKKKLELLKATRWQEQDQLYSQTEFNKDRSEDALLINNQLKNENDAHKKENLIFKTELRARSLKEVNQFKRN